MLKSHPDYRSASKELKKIFEDTHKGDIKVDEFILQISNWGTKWKTINKKSILTEFQWMEKAGKGHLTFYNISQLRSYFSSEL